VKENFAGRRGSCPHCHTSIEVPSANAERMPDTPQRRVSEREARLREILDAFDGEIEPIRTTCLYRLGLLFVTIAMVLLPVVYVLLIVGVIGLLIVYAIYGIGVIRHIHSIYALIFFYVGPLAAGAILIFFMIKPLFAGRAKAGKPFSLGVGEAPLLVAFVSRIARAVGAPEPKRIDINCEVNASAGFGSVLGGFFGGDFVLTIGLPLMSELSIQEFAGVLAHELGHFSQGAGMRLSYVIHRINAWFHRVVFERDTWDESLLRTSEEESRLAVIFLLARLFVFVTRCILGLLMAVGHGLSCFLSRQQEFDADRFQVRLAGTAAFAGTFRKFHVLSAAGELAFMELVQCSATDRVPDDFPALITAKSLVINAKLLRALERAMTQSATGLFDTHPSYSDRLANAKRENTPGIFHLDGPASRLLDPFSKFSRAATRELYKELFGKRLKRMDVVPAAALHVDRTAPLPMSE
jgi:Zn-dependent protease with chaperone function